MDSDSGCDLIEYSSSQHSLTSNMDDPRDIQFITKVLDANIEKCILELLESFDHLTQNMFKVPRNDGTATTKNHILTIDV